MNDYISINHTNLNKENNINISNKNFNREKIDGNKNKINLIYIAKSKGLYNILGKKFIESNKNNIDISINGKKNKLVEKFELKEGKNIITIVIKNKLINLSHMFFECDTLKDIYELKFLNVSECTNFENMFCGCKSLVDIKPLQNWNVSNCINFRGMFSRCESLSDINPLQYWNVSNGKDFSFMFNQCIFLKDIQPLNNLDASKGNNFESMFFGCPFFFDKKLLKSWKVSNIHFLPECSKDNI